MGPAYGGRGHGAGFGAHQHSSERGWAAGAGTNEALRLEPIDGDGKRHTERHGQPQGFVEVFAVKAGIGRGAGVTWTLGGGWTVSRGRGSVSHARVRCDTRRRVKLFGANTVHEGPHACIRVRCQLVRRRTVNEPSIATLCIGPAISQCSFLRSHLLFRALRQGPGSFFVNAKPGAPTEPRDGRA